MIFIALVIFAFTGWLVAGAAIWDGERMRNQLREKELELDLANRCHKASSELRGEEISPSALEIKFTNTSCAMRLHKDNECDCGLLEAQRTAEQIPLAAE